MDIFRHMTHLFNHGIFSKDMTFVLNTKSHYTGNYIANSWKYELNKSSTVILILLAIILKWHEPMSNYCAFLDYHHHESGLIFQINDQYVNTE